MFKRKRADDSLDQCKKPGCTLPQRSWYKQLYELIYGVIPEYDLSTIVGHYCMPSVQWTYVGRFQDETVWDMFQADVGHLMGQFRITGLPSDYQRMIGIGCDDGAVEKFPTVDPWNRADWTGFYTCSTRTSTSRVVCRGSHAANGVNQLRRLEMRLNDLSKMPVSMSVHSGRVCFSVDNTHSKSFWYTGNIMTVCVGQPRTAQILQPWSFDQLTSSFTVEHIHGRPDPSPCPPMAIGDYVLNRDYDPIIGTVEELSGNGHAVVCCIGGDRVRAFVDSLSKFGVFS